MVDQPANSNDHEDGERKKNQLLRIRTVFKDELVLQKIGRHLLEKNLITGFEIREIKAGYKHRGTQRIEKQFELNILTPFTIDAEKKTVIYRYIESTIGKHWDVPKIEEGPASLNEAMRLFVEGKESTETKLRRIRRNARRTLYLLLGLTTLGGAIGGTAFWVDREHAGEVKTERQKIYGEISDLERKMEEMTRELNRKLILGEKLTIEDGGEFGVQSVEEINQIRDEVRRLEFSIRKLKDQE